MPSSPPSPRDSDPACTFCRIIQGKIQASVIFEDAISLTFLEQRPLFPGHCLLIPKLHVETLADLPSSLVGPLFQNAQLLERVIETGLSAEGTFLAINNHISQSAPHRHLHLVPRRRKDGFKGFFWPRQRYQDEATQHQVQEALRSAIARLYV